MKKETDKDFSATEEILSNKPLCEKIIKGMNEPLEQCVSEQDINKQDINC